MQTRAQVNIDKAGPITNHGATTMALDYDIVRKISREIDRLDVPPPTKAQLARAIGRKAREEESAHRLAIMMGCQREIAGRSSHD